MAIQWMDDFNGYGTDGNRLTRMLDGVYAELNWVDLTPDPDPLIGATKYVAQVQTNTASRLRRVLNSTQTTVGVAQRVWLTALPFDTSVAPFLAHFSDINNFLHIYVGVNPSGYIYVNRRDTPSDVQLGITANPVVIANAWRHYEIKVVLHASAGSVEIRVEGQTVLNVTGIRTTSNIGGVAAGINNIYWYNSRLLGPGPTMYVKDVIVWDGTGSANNNFMGSCQVYKIIPDGDTALGWTPSSGSTGNNLINETTPDDDTNYISAPYPPPSFSQFTMTNLPANVSSVRGVQIIHRTRKTDGGDGQVQTSAITSGGTSNGSDRTISSAYTYWWDVFDVAPGGGGWSKTLVDGMTVKINRTV